MTVTFIERIDVSENDYEDVRGLTKLRNEIYVLGQSLFLVFEDRTPFLFRRKIEFKETLCPYEIGSSEKENCLYVADQEANCIWKITGGDQYNTSKWLTTDSAPLNMSLSSKDQLMVITESSSTLSIYGSNAELIQSIQLPRDIIDPTHAVEKSIGNFISLHEWMTDTTGENGSRERQWIVSELTRDGQIVVRRFIPRNETQKLNRPEHILLDSNDRVFIADTRNHRVILLDSDLNWFRVICPQINKEEDEDNDDKLADNIEQTMIRSPQRLCYDEEQKKLIVAGKFIWLDVINVYSLSRT